MALGWHCLRSTEPRQTSAMGSVSSAWTYRVEIRRISGCDCLSETSSFEAGPVVQSDYGRGSIGDLPEWLWGYVGTACASSSELWTRSNSTEEKLALMQELRNLVAATLRSTSLYRGSTSDFRSSNNLSVIRERASKRGKLPTCEKEVKAFDPVSTPVSTENESRLIAESDMLSRSAVSLYHLSAYEQGGGGDRSGLRPESNETKSKVAK